jgi:hypothetical protein
MNMSYDLLREQYKPEHITLLLVAESPPPAADVQSSRHFYRSDRVRRDDRLFVNTIRALYPEAAEQTEAVIETEKERWLRQLQRDGVYMIEALAQSQEHEVTKRQRQERIAEALPELERKIKALADDTAGIILIKSNVFDVAAGPLRSAGLQILNTELVDYPGRFNQRAYREKLNSLAREHKKGPFNR